MQKVTVMQSYAVCKYLLILSNVFSNTAAADQLIGYNGRPINQIASGLKDWM